MNWLVIGAGISGAAAAQWLAKQGHHVRVSEAKVLNAAQKAVLENCGCEVCDGGHDPLHLADIQKVLVSPGLSPTHPLLGLAVARGLPIVSEIDLALADYAGQIIAVTGTNGKSTNCAMLAHILQVLGEPVALTGNIGVPPSALKLEGDLPPYLVVELSSYQLEQSVAIKPTIAIFTNFADDHLGRHGTREAYFRAKWSLILALKEDGLAILSTEVLKEARQYELLIPSRRLVLVDKQPTAGEFAILKGNLYCEGGSMVPMAPAKIVFPHNLINAAVSIIAISRLLNYPAAALPICLAKFKSLPHRCENIGSWRGRTVYEDSKATNVASVNVALAGVKAPVYLLLGGQPKGESFQPLLLHQEKVRSAFLFGEARQQMAAELGSALRTSQYKTLADAIEGLAAQMQADPQTVLFSPGCASFDEFANFAARGDFFKAQISKFLD